jgi:hypothetical protein
MTRQLYRPRATLIEDVVDEALYLGAIGDIDTYEKDEELDVDILNVASHIYSILTNKEKKK